MSEVAENLDPFKFWQTMRDISLDAWSKIIIDLLNTKTYAKTTSIMLNSYLMLSLPSQQILEKLIMQALTKANTATRKDINNLAEQLANIDIKLDDLTEELQLLKRSYLAEQEQVEN